MNGLQRFRNNEFGEIRTLNDNGKILFCGSDIAKALGYQNAPDALARHCKGIVKRYTPTGGGRQVMSFISEGDVYRLIAHSRLPEATRFESWIFDEVLPTIRKTGGYVLDENLFIKTYLPDLSEPQKNIFMVTLSQLRVQNEKIEADRPKVQFAEAVAASDNTILIRELAVIMKQRGFDVGQQRLFSLLRRDGYLIRKEGKSHNLPTQRCMDMGLMEIRESEYGPKDDPRISLTPVITGKGQIYFIDRYLSKYKEAQ